MKNSILSTLLALWFVLMPGFGLNFLSGNPMNMQTDQNEKSTAVAVTGAAPSGAVVDRQTPIVTKNQVASARPAYPSSTR